MRRVNWLRRPLLTDRRYPSLQYPGQLSRCLDELLEEICKIVILELKAVRSLSLVIACRKNAEQSFNKQRPCMSQLISGDFNIRACRRREDPLSKVAAAARATTVLKQCNELDYAPRDLMRRTNVAHRVSAWLRVALKAHMVPSLKSRTSQASGWKHGLLPVPNRCVGLTVIQDRVNHH